MTKCTKGSHATNWSLAIPAPRSCPAILWIVFLLFAGRTAGFAKVVDFSTLTGDTVLTDQLKTQGVVVLPYGETVLAQIDVDRATGNKIARFNVCKYCEVYQSGANIALTVLHGSVKVHVGLMAHPPSPNGTRPVTLEAFDAAGNSLGTQTLDITSGSGFSSELSVTSASTNIARFTVDSRNDPTISAEIALLDITLDDGDTMAADFFLQGHAPIWLVRGGSAVDATVNIARLGGFAGPITFIASGGPADVHVTFPSGTTTSGDTIAVRLSGDFSGVSDFTQKVTLTGSSGAIARSVVIPLNMEPAVDIDGPHAIDVSTCSWTVDGGTITIPLYITRDPTVLDPILLRTLGLPTSVFASFDVNPVVFSGTETLAKVNMSLVVPPGVSYPATSFVLHAPNRR